MNSRRNPKETAKRGTRSHSKPTGKLNHKTKTTAAPKSFTVNEPSELLPFLLTHVTGRGRNAIKSILSRGQVSVNDKVVTQHNFQLHPGQNVTIDQEKPVQTAEMIGLKIVHEDEDLIIVQKDAGLLSIATAEENELTAYRQLMEHVRVSNPKSDFCRTPFGQRYFRRNDVCQKRTDSAGITNYVERYCEGTFLRSARRRRS